MSILLKKFQSAKKKPYNRIFLCWGECESYWRDTDIYLIRTNIFGVNPPQSVHFCWRCLCDFWEVSGNVNKYDIYGYRLGGKNTFLKIKKGNFDEER